MSRLNVILYAMLFGFVIGYLSGEENAQNSSHFFNQKEIRNGN